MEAINFRNFIKLKERFRNISDIEKKLEKNSNDLLKKLEQKIDSYVQKYDWNIDKVKTEIKVGKTKRGIILVEKPEKDYRIGIEHFNPNFDDSKLRADNIFCGMLDKKANEDRDDKWTDKKNVSDYKGIELKINSMEYVNLLLTEDIDNLVCHFFEEFKTYFNNNK